MELKKHGLKNASSNKYAPVRLIGFENFEEEVIEERKPVLLLCMDRNAKFQEQIKVIKSISKTYGAALKVGLLEEEFIGAFKQRFSVLGTPTFLVFVNGSEKDRMLGLTNEEALTEFLSETLPHFRRKK